MANISLDFGGSVRYASYFSLCVSQRLLKLAAMAGFSLCLRKGESEPPKFLYVFIAGAVSLSYTLRRVHAAVQERPDSSNTGWK
ncbi:hypothetical protein RND71_036367 [Anisodus tanguticus]|uniref:Uncharacterized protein n=1 Tax=Anisodus tanguticus TaxID=243964 RepID=A0AAE1R1C7_9SOLA|nr:hypothetical protein RND71_036367 [Anisodus tanguticus]